MPHSYTSFFRLLSGDKKKINNPIQFKFEGINLRVTLIYRFVRMNSQCDWQVQGISISHGFSMIINSSSRVSTQLSNRSFSVQSCIKWLRNRPLMIINLFSQQKNFTYCFELSILRTFLPTILIFIRFYIPHPHFISNWKNNYGLFAFLLCVFHWGFFFVLNIVVLLTFYSENLYRCIPFISSAFFLLQLMEKNDK